MIQGLEIGLAPERLAEGTQEERAAFGMLTIRAGNMSLTEGFDWFIDALRPGPLVSGYHAAEWFAWNWWRIMHEPFSPRSTDWWRAHCMTAIGEGYVWPNLTFRTDGVRAAVIVQPSPDVEGKPFRYIGSNAWLGPSVQMTGAIDTFLTRIAHRVAEQGIPDSNLHRILADLRGERADPEMAERRRLEALLGHDPDEADDGAIQALLDDAHQLGRAGVDELAADAVGGPFVRSSTLQNIADAEGVDVRLSDAVRFSTTELHDIRDQQVGWRQGRDAAQVLRLKENLGAAPVSTTRLAAMAGTAVPDPHRKYGMAPLSFVLRGDNKSKLVLKSKWDTGRRFELARLLGDHLLFGSGAPILPATRAYTFRQKVQRSFAAEFLCPFEAAEEMLNGDFSAEAIEEVAEYFHVSTLTVETLLRNHGMIEREFLADAA
jgi:hypothetical protein